MGDDRWVWVNGRFHKQFDPVFSASDRGALIGDGAFETLLAIDGVCVFADAHLNRLKTGLDILRIPSPDFSQLDTTIRRLWSKNDVGAGKASVRITVTRGAAGRGVLRVSGGVAPTCCISLENAPPPPQAPVRLTLSERVRPSTSSVNGFKSISGYQEHQLARFEAGDRGFDDAVLVNEFGRIVCASAANLFLIGDEGALITPPPSEGAMPGVIRAEICAIARELGVECRERSVSPSMIEGRWVMLTNSLIGVTPGYIEVAPQGAPPPIVERIRERLDARQFACLEQALASANAENSKSV